MESGSIDDRIVENIQRLCMEAAASHSHEIYIDSALGLAHFMHVLFSEYIVIDPDNASNPLRDIFVLSKSHATLLHLVMEFLIGRITLEELRSRPLSCIRLKTELALNQAGQGVAAAVGFAASITLLKNHCGPSSPSIFCVFGDGCYQEGVAQEAFSLASSLGLSGITFIYDYNRRTVDGHLSLSSNEDIVSRFSALSFTVVEASGSDTASIRAALAVSTSMPKVIVLRSFVPGISELKRSLSARKKSSSLSNELVKCYEAARKRMSDEISRRPPFLMPRTSENAPWYPCDYFVADQAPLKHFADALDDMVPAKPLIVGCADVTPFVLAKRSIFRDFGQETFLEAYVRYGKRENAMCAFANGMASHSFFIPVCGTFLDSICNAIQPIRLAALNALRVIYVLSYCSRSAPGDPVGDGGASISQNAGEALGILRTIAGLIDLRPCDGRETRAAFLVATKANQPSAIILSGDRLKEIAETEKNVARNENGKCIECAVGVQRGAYFLVEEKEPDILLVASGSDVHVAYGVEKILRGSGIKTSIASFISLALFERQPVEYRRKILYCAKTRVCIDTLSKVGWEKYVDIVIGLEDISKNDPRRKSAVYETPEVVSYVVAKKVREYLEDRNVTLNANDL